MHQHIGFSQSYDGVQGILQDWRGVRLHFKGLNDGKSWLRSLYLMPLSFFQRVALLHVLMCVRNGKTADCLSMLRNGLEP